MLNGPGRMGIRSQNETNGRKESALDGKKNSGLEKKEICGEKGKNRGPKANESKKGNVLPPYALEYVTRKDFP